MAQETRRRDTYGIHRRLGGGTCMTQGTRGRSTFGKGD